MSHDISLRGSKKVDRFLPPKMIKHKSYERSSPHKCASFKIISNLLSELAQVESYKILKFLKLEQIVRIHTATHAATSTHQYSK